MLNETDYIYKVQEIAEGAPKRNRLAYIHEHVDWCDFIVYYANNEIVISTTQNEPNDDDIRAWHVARVSSAMARAGRKAFSTAKGDALVLAGTASWRTLRNTAAKLAMYADVQDEIARLES